VFGEKLAMQVALGKNRNGLHSSRLRKTIHRSLSFARPAIDTSARGSILRIDAESERLTLAARRGRKPMNPEIIDAGRDISGG
jgi:hypothetical protein